MTESTQVSAEFLLQQATRYGFVSAGLFCFASCVTVDNLFVKIIVGLLGFILVILAFSKISEKLVTYLAQRRGQGYISTFSNLLLLLLVLASAMAIAFPLMIIVRGYEAPVDILVALILEIIIVLMNLFVLISNLTASRH